MARREIDAPRDWIRWHWPAADAAFRRGSAEHRLSRRRVEGQAEAQGEVREERERAHHRGSVRQLYGRGRRGQRRPRDAESHGHDLRPLDAGGAGVWASRESRYLDRVIPEIE